MIHKTVVVGGLQRGVREDERAGNQISGHSEFERQNEEKRGWREPGENSQSVEEGAVTEAKGKQDPLQREETRELQTALRVGETPGGIPDRVVSAEAQA